MNKKILFTIVTLFSLIVLVVPTVGACQNRRNNRWENFSAFMISGPPAAPPVITLYPPPPEEPETRVVELQETMIVCDLSFGGDTYHLGVDFTYESQLTIRFDLSTDPLVGSLRATKTITFDPNSPNHDIDGTLKFLVIGKMWPEPNPDPDDAMDSYGVVIAWGTGDLKGVRILGTGWHDDSENIIYQGKVKGWPV
jgi:hypothetical protein